MLKKTLNLMLVFAILLGIVAPASAGTCAIFRSWNNGDQLTASDLTTSFVTTTQTNMIPTCMSSDSPNVAGMQANQDPYNNGAGPESLAIDEKGELERIRFVLKKLTGWPQWYRYDQPLVFPTGGGTSTFTAIAVTNNTNEIALGTTNVGTMTLAGGALTAARTWTWPDITGVVALTNGGQTFSSGVWNGSIIGTVFGGTGLDTHLAANGSLLIGNGAGWTNTTLTAGPGMTITNGAGAVTLTPASGSSYKVGGLVGANNATTPNTKYDLTADLVVLRNTTTGATITKVNTGTITNDTGLAGSAANGRDQAGAFSASSWINFYFIAKDDGTLATLSSAVAPPTGPTLPATYTSWAYAGAVFNNATPLLVKTRMRGSKAFYEAQQGALVGGSATVETSINLAAFIPPNALSYRAYATFLNASNAVSSTTFRIVTGVAYLSINQTVAVANSGVATVGSVDFPNIGQSVAYINSAAGDSTGLNIQGYTVPNGGE